MTEKRFKKGYCCGDTGLIDNEKEEWFVENINSISDLERNWNDVLDKLNEVADENEQLKADNNRLVNETAKVVAEHQGRVLDLIDDEIDELEKKYKFGQEVYKGCPMHNIRFGINTLKELKKELQK